MSSDVKIGLISEVRPEMAAAPTALVDSSTAASNKPVKERWDTCGANPDATVAIKRRNNAAFIVSGCYCEKCVDLNGYQDLLIARFAFFGLQKSTSHQRAQQGHRPKEQFDPSNRPTE